MKIVKLKTKLDERWNYPIPKNLVNRMMFSYPYPLPQNGYEEGINRKVNGLVCYWGEKFGDKKWAIGMMGFDNMVIFDEKGKEVECYYNLFVHDNRRFVYVLKNLGDWDVYTKNKKIYKRMEKIDKILNP